MSPPRPLFAKHLIKALYRLFVLQKPFNAVAYEEPGIVLFSGKSTDCIDKEPQTKRHKQRIHLKTKTDNDYHYLHCIST